MDPRLHPVLIFVVLLARPVKRCTALGQDIGDLGWNRAVASCQLSASEDGRQHASPPFTATVYYSAKGIQSFEPVAVIGMCDFSGGLESLFVPCEQAERPHHLSYQPATSVWPRAGQSGAESPEEQKGWFSSAKKKATVVTGYFTKLMLDRVISFLEERRESRQDHWLLCEGFPIARNAAFTPIINWGWALRRYASRESYGNMSTIPAS